MAVEGDIISNPSTGERRVLKGGKWEAMPSAVSEPVAIPPGWRTRYQLPGMLNPSEGQAEPNTRAVTAAVRTATEGAIISNPVTGERLVLTDGKWEPVRSGVTAAFDFARSVASGVTGGFNDEISAALNSALSGDTYEESLAIERKRNAEIPLGTQIGGEIVGSIAVTAATLGAVNLAPVAVASRIGAMFSKLPKFLQTTGLGALWGGLYGAGSAEGDSTDRLEGAAWGTALGAATGGGIHGGAKALGSGLKAIKGIAKARVTPEKQAATLLGQKLAADGVTPDQVLTRLRELGPQATIADAAGDNVIGLARGVVGITGSGKEKITRTLKVRGLGESDRVSRSVTRDLGPKDYFASEAAFLLKLQMGARAAYGEAYHANPNIQSAALDKVLQAPSAQDALKKAAKIAGDNRVSGSEPWLVDVGEELIELARIAALHAGGDAVGNPGVSRGLSLQTWNYVKIGLDALLDNPSNKNELTGALTTSGKAIYGVQKELVAALDKATGGKKSLYAAARKQYAGDAKVLESLREGLKFNTLLPEQIKRHLAGLSDASREAYRKGAAQAILKIVESTPDTASVARRLHATKMSRDRIAAVFPDRKRYMDYARRMVAEQKFTETQQAIGSGSRTAPMTEEIADLARTAGHGGAVVGSSMGVASPLVVAGIMRNKARQAVNVLAGGGGGVNKTLAGWLVTRNRADQLRILDLVRPHAVPPSGTGGIQKATVGTIAAGSDNLDSLPPPATDSQGPLEIPGVSAILKGMTPKAVSKIQAALQE